MDQIVAGAFRCAWDDSSPCAEGTALGDVIWLSAGDICGVEARLFDGTNIVKGLKASLSTPSVFAPGDKVESGCGEALVLQPYKIAVLRAKAEHLLSAQPTSPGELKSKSTSELHGAITKADPALRKSGNLPAVAPKQDKHNIAVLDAKRAAAMSRITCMIMGIRGIITVDKTEVGAYSCAYTHYTHATHHAQTQTNRHVCTVVTRPQSLYTSMGGYSGAAIPYSRQRRAVRALPVSCSSRRRLCVTQPNSIPLLYDF